VSKSAAGAHVTTSRSRRPLLLGIGGGVGMLLLVAAAVMVLSEPSEAGAEPTVIELAQSSSGATTESSTEGMREPELLSLVTNDVYLDRDPFEPVLRVAEADGGGSGEEVGEATPAQPANGRVVVDPVTGQLIVVQDPPQAEQPPAPVASAPGEPTPAGPGPTPVDETGRCRGGEEMVCDGHVVTLHEVRTNAAGPVAVMQVDTTNYEVSVGETFATSFRVLSIEGQCVTFLYGDDTSTLCVGQRTLK
jgi:hypothetical protein